MFVNALSCALPAMRLKLGALSTAALSGLLAICAAVPLHAQEAAYTVAPQPWPESLGNHRAVVRVEKPGDAILAHLPWRRHDDHPEQKAVLVYDPSGSPVMNSRALRVTSESGDVIFEARQAGEYLVYYFPHAERSRSAGEEEYRAPQSPEKGQYRAPQPTADPAWTKRYGKGLTQALESGLPRAQVKEFQARTAFDSFYPMEVAATEAEVRQLEGRHAQELLLFPEDREHPIRMRDRLPLRWIQSGPSRRFSGRAYRGEFYVFQVGIYAPRKARAPDTMVDVVFDDLAGPDARRIRASASTCINTDGVDTAGRPFRRDFTVRSGRVSALWCGVEIPLEAVKGRYTGALHLKPRGGAEQTVDLAFDVDSAFIRAGGVDQPARLARIKWLNSTAGLTDAITSPYTPLRVEDRTVSCLGRQVRFVDSGFPSSVKAGDREVLAGPVALQVYEGEQPVAWKSRSRIESAAAAKAVLASESDSEKYRLRVVTTMEFDGGIGFDVTLRAQRDTAVSDVALEIPYRKDAAPYAAGMSLNGGRRPAEWQWKWTDQPPRWKEQGSNLEYFLWMGNVHAGLYCRLKSPQDGWRNNGAGGVRIVESGERVVFRAFSGKRSFRQGEEVKFSFRLLPTPVKPIDPNQWDMRYAHTYRPVEELKAAGASVVNIHHDLLPNLYINYPFLNLDVLTPYIAEAHEAGLKAKIYYTVRELTTHLPELWAFRSLDNEIYKTAGTQGHGKPELDHWLQEHLQSDYLPAWITRTPAGDIDAAIRVYFDSRLDNFYLEGLSWLLRNVPIDGIYLDEIGYRREIMQRVRRVIEQRSGATIDLHGNRTWWSCNSPAGYYMEHFPYVDRLWFGEAFDPDSPPDFWLVEMSGLPFGLHSDMLEHPNPWRGMLFGMTSRSGYPGAIEPGPIWKVWDSFGIRDAAMLGWWEEDTPVRTGSQDVLATVYRKPGSSLIALASWARERSSVSLQIDWGKLGIDPARARLTAPEIAGFQNGRTFAAGEPIPVEPGKGWLILVEQR